MYNWLRPVSTGQAPTRSRPAGVRWARPAACVLDHPLQLESSTLSTHYIRVHIQVIITFMYTFKLFSTPALLYTRPCTPLPAAWLLYTRYSLHSCTHSSYYYIHVHMQVILHALHCFTRGCCLHSFTPSTWGVKAPPVQFITLTFKLFSTPCTPLQFGGPGALHTTPCTVTPLHWHLVLTV